jgi:hypothetical protein
LADLLDVGLESGIVDETDLALDLGGCRFALGRFLRGRDDAQLLPARDRVDRTGAEQQNREQQGEGTQLHGRRVEVAGARRN